MGNQDKTKYNSFVAELATQLIVPVEMLSASSALDLNVDANKVIFAAVNSQKLYIEPTIGSALLRKLQEDTLPFAYQLLLDRFLNDAIINYAMSEAVRSLAYSVMNGGVYSHLPTDAEPVSTSVLSTIRQDYLSKGDLFLNRCVEFLCKNKSFYPEYSESLGDGVTASKRAKYTGGLLIETGSCGDSHVGGPDASIFVATTSWGNSNEVSPTFDPAVLSGQANELPPDVFAQPVDNYFWIVSEVDFKIQQMGIDIPLDDFNNVTPEEGEYVKTNVDDLFWIRIKIAQVYEEQVQFQVVLV